MVLKRIKTLASNDIILQHLTDETNARLLKQKPTLEKRRQGLIKNLADIKNQTDKLLEHLPSLNDETGSAFIREKLADLAERRRDLENGLAQTEYSFSQIQEQAVKCEEVKKALSCINDIYSQLKPFEKRDLMGLLLKSAKINESSIELEIYTLNEAQLETLNTRSSSEKVRTPPNWLPLIDAFRNNTLELGLDLPKLKHSFQAFNISQIVNTKLLGSES